jgi:hypothetical protein
MNMNNTALNYHSSNFTGLVRHSWGRSSVVRDSDTEIQWRHLPKLELEAQIRSGDYFINLATILDALGRDIESYDTRAGLEDLVSDLIYMQDNYTITKNEQTE